MGDSRTKRVSDLREALGRAHLDALLVTSQANIRYLTGFSGSSALLLVRGKECLLLTDFRYATQVEEEVGALATIRIETTSLWSGLWTQLATTLGVERIGFESAHLLHRDFQRLLEQGARWQWRPTVDLIEQLRACKDDDELSRIQRAVVIAELALSTTLPLVTVGMTETQLAGILEHNLRDAGSEGFPFASIVSSGPRSALPHARASTRALRTGDFLLMDFGAVFEGYCSDITRTVVVGKASEAQREMYETVREANRRASGALRAGMRCQAADAVARDYIDALGFGDEFGHSLGHGIGLEIHEAPRLAKSSEALLPTGSVVTIEPGMYRAGWGGVRIEDDVHVTADGPRVLTSFTSALLELD